jgi:hypothetical protein
MEIVILRFSGNRGTVPRALKSAKLISRMDCSSVASDKIDPLPPIFQHQQSRFAQMRNAVYK